MPDRTVGAWIFGKLPSHGDFVGRGLQPGQRGLLDAWLSSEMVLARECIGDEFEAHYDTAPPWCFTCEDPAGTWQAGAMCPSKDSAGRRFPLILAVTGVTPAQAEDAARQGAERLFEAFAQNYDADALVAAIVDIDSATGDEPAGDGWWAQDEQGHPIEHRDGVRPVGLLRDMLQGGECV